MSISFSSPTNRDARARGAGVTAVLGPTNTGKTHLAIERMLGHSSGIIGLPLRLLAREVYNKVCERAGADAVALVTGEEKIKPPNPRFWVSTVEAMPRDLDVAFVAIDEVQLGADLERGHVFTDRMLNRRGREETLVLGAATVRPMVERLLPGAHVLTRPRLSQLTFAGEKKLTRQPRRTAIVTFSADEVYAIAELIRRQRGGAAVVLGSLSPRTRNAQVALYQSGDVDYLVATDAIGMGLNLDVDHVAFASDRKFDGYQFRRLNPAELAQVAGRAGRANRDGTFGTTGRCPAFETELVQALESHLFEPLRVLQWRNTALDFASLGALQATLAETPKENGLTRAPIAEDILVLEHAAREDDVRGFATTRAAVERLWDVCQVPDYRKISPATHAELVVTLYTYLMREGNIPTDWFAQQVAQADNTTGDIDSLSNRISHIRTWTFAANRPDWLAEPEHWQGVTRAVEDKLSDALHERLTERFVDRRTSVLSRRLREDTPLETEIGKTGEVVVEGHPIGRLDGFTFTPDASAAGSDAKALAGAAQKALAGEIDARAHRLSHAASDQIVLANDGVLRWLGQPVGRLTAGDDVLRPRVRIIADEHLTGASRDAVQVRLDLWLKTHIERLLGPLFQLGGADDITGIARGLAFQVVEALGVLERAKVTDDVKGLDQASRGMLRKYGVRFGAYHLYLPLLLKPAPRVLATQLWALKHEGPESKGLDTVERLAGSGRTSIAADKDVAKSLYRMAGYRVCGERAVRVDILERLADLIRAALSWRAGSPTPKPAGAFDGRGFTATTGMTSLTGCSGENFASVLRSLGYRMDKRPKPPAVVETAPTLPVGETAAVAPAEASAVEGAAADGVPQPVEAPAAPDALAEVAAPESDAVAPAEPTVDVLPEASTPPETARAADKLPVVEFMAVAPEPPPASSAEQVEPASVPVVRESEEVSEPAAVSAEPAEPAAEATAEVLVARQEELAAAAEIAAAAPVAEELIEVWRPGRPEGQRRPPRRPPPHRRDAAARPDRRPADASAAADAVAAAPEGVSTPAEGVPIEGAPAPAGDGGSADEQRSRHRRHGRGDRPEREERGDRPQRADRGPRPDRPDRGPRPDRPRGDRPDRGPRRDRDRADRDPELRKYFKGRDDNRRDKAPDPDLALRQARRLESAARGEHEGAAIGRERALDRQRIDKWLWHARVVRTRSAAAALADAGLVRINGQRIEASSRPVRPGDVVTVALDRAVRVLKVTGFAERRGSAETVAALCEDVTPPAVPQPAGPSLMAARDPGAGRPTKRDRRVIDRFVGEDEG